MDPILKKLQLKPQMKLSVLRAPEESRPLLKAWSEHVLVKTRQSPKDDAVLVFVKAQKDIDALVPKVIAKLDAATLLWMAYPKKSSKLYRCDISRDKGWQALGEQGFEPVRQIAIDENWSALRFRALEQIKRFEREAKHAISDAGKRRAQR